MKIRDPHVTLQLEAALEWLVRFPKFNLALVGAKFDVEPGLIGAWLREFAGGTAVGLTLERIRAVKEELGIVGQRTAAHAVGAPGGNHGGARTVELADPPPEPAVAGAGRILPPATRAPEDPPPPAVAGGRPRWESAKKLRAGQLAKWIPVLRAIAAGTRRDDALQAADLQDNAFQRIKSRYFGGDPLTGPTVEAFVAYLAAHAATPAGAKSVAKIAVLPNRPAGAPATAEVKPLRTQPPAPSPVETEIPAGAPMVLPITIRLRLEVLPMIGGAS